MQKGNVPLRSDYGGTSLLVARVTSGSYTPATSTTINSYLDPTSASFALETISEGTLMNNSGALGANGTLVSGSISNIRWEISNSNTGSGTFNLLIRQGNDTESNKIVLESWNNVNLDPNSSRYIARVIGDQVSNYDPVDNQMETIGNYPNNSRYVRVKSVDLPTINYFDANGIAVSNYTASLPQNGSGTN